MATSFVGRLRVAGSPRAVGAAGSPHRQGSKRDPNERAERLTLGVTTGTTTARCI